MTTLNPEEIITLIKNNESALNTRFSDVKDKNDIAVEDIGDGNLNNVIKVLAISSKEEEISKSSAIIIKHAPSYVKCIGPDFPLSPERMKIEFRSLKKYNNICPGSVPQPYCYDDNTHSTLMEYLHGYEVMKTQLIKGKLDKVALQRLAENIGKIHSATHVSNISVDEFEHLKQDFQNESLCELTRNFIFTYPFIKGQDTNYVNPIVQKAAEEVYSDQSLLQSVDKFKRIFLENAECLVHGDLHTGSVMVKDGVPKIIDNEFTFVGPAAFDVGLLISHFMISYHQHLLTEENNRLHREYAYKMIDACKRIVSSYLEYFQPSVEDRTQFIKDFMSNVAGFAGCELLRRVLGVAHVEDIKHSGSMELEVLQCGRRLLGAHNRIQSIDRLIFIGLQLC